MNFNNSTLLFTKKLCRFITVIYYILMSTGCVTILDIKSLQYLNYVNIRVNFKYFLSSRFPFLYENVSNKTSFLENIVLID